MAPRQEGLTLIPVRPRVRWRMLVSSKLAQSYPAMDEAERRSLRLAIKKRGLASALHSSDKAYEALPAYLEGRWGPALQGLVDAASMVALLVDGLRHGAGQ